MRAKPLLLPFLILLTAGHFFPVAAQAATDTLKVYLLAGQSNMEGQSYTYDSTATGNWNVPTMEFLLSGTPAATNYLANMPFDFKNSLDASWFGPRDDVWGVHYDSRTGNLKDILPTNNQADIVTGIQPMMPGFGVGTGFGSMIGPELGMGHHLGDLMQSPIFLFKSDKGGTTLGNDWRPPTAVAARGGSIGPEYTNTMASFTGFLDTLDADLADDGKLNAYNNAVDYEVAGVFWFQGWNEKFNDDPYTASQLQAEYSDNLKDLIYSIRAADSRIPNDLGIIIGESSDQHAGLNASRIAAVAQLNSEIPNSAAYFDTANMKGTNWGNNNSGVPFSQGWGYHFHARAENFLEIGWKAGAAAIEIGLTGSEVVPEPSTVAMLLTGLAATALFGRRQRRSGHR